MFLDSNCSRIRSQRPLFLPPQKGHHWMQRPFQNILKKLMLENSFSSPVSHCLWLFIEHWTVIAALVLPPLYRTDPGCVDVLRMHKEKVGGQEHWEQEARRNKVEIELSQGCVVFVKTQAESCSASVLLHAIHHFAFLTLSCIGCVFLSD